MLVRLSLATCLAAAMLAPAAAQDGGDTGASQPVKEKKICRRELATGSVMAKVTCRTKAEWEAITARSQNDLQRTQDLERSRSAVNRGVQ